MLTELEQILPYDTALLETLPLWQRILFLVLWLAPAVICLLQDRRALFSRWGESRNTIHTAFWPAVILTLPLAGSVLYAAGSLLPCLILHRRGGSVVTFRLRRRQLLTLCLSLLIPSLLGFVIYNNQTLTQMLGSGVLTSYDWTLELSFLCWALIVFSDWFLSVHRCAIYLQPSGLPAPAEAGKLLGAVRYRTEDPFPQERSAQRREIALLRQTADTAFRHHVYGPELPGKRIRIMEDGREHSFLIVGTAQEWLREQPDFFETRELGRGIARCTVAAWEKRSGEERCTESVLYRAVPSLTGWLCRAGILLTVQAAAAAPPAAALHMKLTAFLIHSISG